MLGCPGSVLGCPGSVLGYPDTVLGCPGSVLLTYPKRYSRPDLRCSILALRRASKGFKCRWKPRWLGCARTCATRTNLCTYACAVWSTERLQEIRDPTCTEDHARQAVTMRYTLHHCKEA
eukprot:8541805-Pyramimonas_sp.AAC.2